MYNALIKVYIFSSGYQLTKKKTQCCLCSNFKAIYKQ